ncbi:putative Swi5-dependent recombination DNA repair protein 1 [Daphnia magna]|uniref:Swi5-dependent recombination DNA repair protein 1 homolog n=1 Tax=Daphnia magna TaxID=35525 RepID=A0A0N8ADE8_9CRUS|nr:putative Swi5-dependent recombination DNA repair protein 1 [Daphnia magna]
MEETLENVSKRIKEKEEILRKLKMIKLHRIKHSTDQLESLIKEWTGICQQALQDLQQKLADQGSDSAAIGIPELLRHLNIEPELVGYCIEDEAFVN